MSMSINTHITSLTKRKWTKKDEKCFQKQSQIFAYSKGIGEKDSKEMGALRKKLLQAIEKDKPNVHDLIKQYEALKEEEFIQKYGMTSAQYEEKRKQEQYERETVKERTCLCLKCYATFRSTRFYPTCTSCGYKQHAIEKKENASIIGKEIKEVYQGESETMLLFTDGTSSTFPDYSQDE